MTKRAFQKFERIGNDLYPTPPSAAAPLLPHLPDRTKFIEPCAGDGRLAIFFNRHGHRCVWACDIKPGNRQIERMNALDIDPAHVKRTKATHFITNPPWDRPILHALIKLLPTMLPTWLLFDADWAHTDLGRKHGAHCAMIVSVGRVKWIEDSPSAGFDNVCWYLFDAKHRGPPKFHWRQGC